MRIDGKVTLITGASEGLGAACAAEFARAGALLSLAARSEEGLRRAGGPEALITAGDLTVEETRHAVVERTMERFGRIDILINNAGVGVYRRSWSTPMDEVRRMWELNFFAALGMAQLAVPHMRERGAGTIVNMSSIAGKFTLPWLPLYSASKSALGAWTEALRMELGRDGIHAMLVCPGYVKTEFHRHAMGGHPPGKVVAGKRFAISPEDCARKIRRGVERRARTVMAPHSGWLLVAAGVLFPGLVEKALTERVS
jgi:short-subunit dehydrogenase